MDSLQWERAQTIFHAALERPAAERDTFIDAECGDDDALRDIVGNLLAQESQDDSLLDRGLPDAARAALGGPNTSHPPQLAFGPYRIKQMLGEGGMGVVYLAERDDIGSVAAVKILRDAWLSPARRERFTLEQRTLATLTHPSIARLYDAGTLPDGTPWFVMEFVDGVPITEYCARQSSPVEARLRLFREVCRGGAARAQPRRHPS